MFPVPQAYNFLNKIKQQYRMSGKLNIVLDIDETLIYYMRKSDISKEELEKYTYIKDDEDNIIVVRPHLTTFLDYLFKHFTVSFWTWSECSYAEGMFETIVKKDHPERELKLILCNTHAELSGETHGNSKDLNWLWYDHESYPNNRLNSEAFEGFHESNTILIDDLPSNSVNSSNSLNSITIEPFALFGEVKNRSDPYKDVSNDICLLEVIVLLERIRRNYNPERNVGKSIFSPANVKQLGLESYMKSIQIYNKKSQKVTSIAKGIGIGDNPWFVSSNTAIVGGKTRKANRRSSYKSKRKARRL